MDNTVRCVVCGIEPRDIKKEFIGADVDGR
jgi:hypothetical protein